MAASTDLKVERRTHCSVPAEADDSELDWVSESTRPIETEGVGLRNMALEPDSTERHSVDVAVVGNLSGAALFVANYPRSLRRRSP